MLRHTALRGVAANKPTCKLHKATQISRQSCGCHANCACRAASRSSVVANTAMPSAHTLTGANAAASWPWENWGSIDWVDWVVQHTQEERAIAEGVRVRDAWDGSIQDIQVEVTNLGSSQWTAEQELQAMESAVSGPRTSEGLSALAGIGGARGVGAGPWDQPQPIEGPGWLVDRRRRVNRRLLLR